MAFVGQNCLVLPKGLATFTRVGDFAVEDARVEMYSSIASIGTQVDESSSNCERESCHHFLSP